MFFRMLTRLNAVEKKQQSWWLQENLVKGGGRALGDIWTDMKQQLRPIVMYKYTPDNREPYESWRAGAEKNASGFMSLS